MRRNQEFPFAAVRRGLLSWFKKNKRDYPWRSTSNWFHLLMAEMMLRRTRADQAERVYSKFTSKFQTPSDALKVSETDLKKLFQPLGLKWRADQLIQTIHHLKDSYENRAFASADDLFEIPGVGEYSNNMIRNRLFGDRLPALDSNMARIICRIEGSRFNAESRRNARVRTIAYQLVKIKQSADLNLAVLDFGALVCKPISPFCNVCPLIRICNFGNRKRKGASVRA